MPLQFAQAFSGVFFLIRDIREEFWDWFFGQSVEWGLVQFFRMLSTPLPHFTLFKIVYEQDWLDYEIENLYWMVESATAGSTWMQQVCGFNM